MEKSQQSLEAQIKVLSNKLNKAERKAKIYFEALSIYADKMNKWDKGEKAREAIKNANNPKYKPLTSEIAQIFRDSPPKWIGPGDEMGGFEAYISGSLGNGHNW